MRSPQSQSLSRNPLVSVIIPAYNASATLDLCLQSVAASSYDQVETIVVCDGCCDASSSVARNYPVRVIHNESRQGAAYARNVGAVAAQGEIFFFVDADCILDTKAIELAVETVQGGEEVVFGCYTPETRAPEFFSQFKNYQHHFTHYHGEDYQTSFWSGCGAITRRAFEDIEGFDVTVQACEDIEFGFALVQKGYKIRLVKQMRAEHLKRYSLRRLLKSDLFGRAVPWTRLTVSGRAEFGKLNTAKRGKRSVVLTALACLALLGGPFQPTLLPAAPVCLAGIWFINADLLGFITRKRGLLFGAGSALTLVAHFWTAGFGYVLGRLAPKYPAERSPAPQYAWAEVGDAPATRSAVAAKSS